MFNFSQVVRLLGYHGNLLRADQEKGPEWKRTRSCFKKKTPKTPKVAEKKLTIPDRSLAQNDLSIRSDSCSLWNVTPMNFRGVFDLSLESNQNA